MTNRGTLQVAILLSMAGALLPSPTPALAGEGRLVEETVHFASLEGNLVGDPADRGILIYLPPSYDESQGQRYPVAYLLHGGFHDHRMWIGESRFGMSAGLHVGSLMDRTIADGTVQELIVVMPDASTAVEGSFYVNTPVLGRFEDYIAGELVEHVDANYRTLAWPESRGIAGHSLGGFGAVYLAMRHPEVYGVVYGHEASALDFDSFVGFQAGLPEALTVFRNGDWNALKEADLRS